MSYCLSMRPRMLRIAPAILSLTFLVLCAAPAPAAERVVLCEEFTNEFCGSCGYAGPALDRLVSVYGDTFAFVQYQMFDFNYSTPFGDDRWNFYGLLYTPTAIFDGTDELEGAVPDYNQQYTIYRANHFLPRRAQPTDVTIDLSAELLSGQTYRISALVGLEADGVGKDLRIYIAQVLDHYPDNKPYHRNGFKQAAATEDITLNPGEWQVIERDLTFDAQSWANQEDIKIIAWAQAPQGAPEVYQAAIRLWPLISLPGDDDADGFADDVDNCPYRYNPDQADADGDGVGDICDNCLNTPNADQLDTDEDSYGDACDNCEVLHHHDQTDNDADGVGNVCDTCPDVPAPGGVNEFGKVLGAMDLDCDIDADDFALWQGCVAGPDVLVPPPGCSSDEFARADADGDGDVDMDDVTTFSLNFTGPLVSPAIYVGVDECVSCHQDNHGDWMNTIHATAFDTLVNAGEGGNVLCYPCHSVGYGEPSGFVSLTATPELADVQCENCHGPGSNHAAQPGQYPLPMPLEADLCGACHQSCHGLCGENHHPQFEQWSESQHKVALEDIRWDPDATDDCLRCHSTDYRLAAPGQEPTLQTAQFGIVCVDCHDPHGGPNNGQLRQPAQQLCAECHTMEFAAILDEPAQPQAEMLHSVGGYYVDGTEMTGPFSQHWYGIPDECAVCHVHEEPYGGPNQPVNSGHLFVANMRACEPCHTEQVATQLVQSTTYEFNLRLGAIGPYFDPNDPLYLDPSTLPPGEQFSYYAMLFNYQLVLEDRSFGAHNPQYARALLDEVELFLGLPPWRGPHDQPDDKATIMSRDAEVRR